jgi:hypothetical protein
LPLTLRRNSSHTPIQIWCAGTSPICRIQLVTTRIFFGYSCLSVVVLEMDATTLPTFQNILTHLRAVRANHLEWLLPPNTDEVFDSSDACLAPLQAFALSQGFAVVTGKVKLSGNPSMAVPMYSSQVMFTPTSMQNVLTKLWPTSDYVTAIWSALVKLSC